VTLPLPAPPTISAVLPAYNESAVIVDIVRRTHRALQDAGVPAFEVIVVDDGSHDETGRLVKDAATTLPEVRVVTHERNRGYGAALRSGFEAASMDLVWLLDSDGQFDPADLPRLLSAWSPGTFVAGFRVHRRDALIRKLNHDAFFSLVRLVIGHTVQDVNCAFKLFPRECGVGLVSEGAIVSTELLLRAQRDGCRFVEVGIEHHVRLAGKATGARPTVVARAFVELVGLRRRLRREATAAKRGIETAPPDMLTRVTGLPQELLDLLVCPKCKGDLIVEDAALRCDVCLLRYRVDDGIPVMLIDEATPVEPAARSTAS
jgi:uncharacterized protein YbaR (Trm112 family)